MSFVSSHSMIIYFVPHEDNKVPQQVDQLAQSSYQSKEKCDHDIMTSPSTPSCHTNNLTNNHLLGCFYDMMVWKGTSLYVDHLSLLIDRLWRLIHLLRTLIVLIQNKNNMITEWLDTKAIGSTVFVSFGNEYFLSSSDLEEIALGLEVKNKGLVVKGWAPQSKILRHGNIGRFGDHCGWSSVLEAMKFGVPIIAMPMHLDQPINARLVEVRVGISLEMVR
ncbi:beta-D-glucosyl crocetin beta-1,6-glucosyltransferase [Tanacetum coccineum]